DLESRIAELRESAPRASEALAGAEAARESAQARRTSVEARRNELARITATQREQVARLRGEIAVAEERKKNARSRRERAELERREGEELGVRVVADREGAAKERAALETELAEANELMRARTAEEEQSRTALVEARTEL